jgi:hypothetical protein
MKEVEGEIVITMKCYLRNCDQKYEGLFFPKTSIDKRFDVLLSVDKAASSIR